MNSVPSQRGWSRFPAFVLAAATAAFAVLWAWPGDDLSRLYRVGGSHILAYTTVFLLLLWWLGYSGVRWSLRVGLPLLVAVASVAAIRKVDFGGDMGPIVEFRWEPDPRDVLDAYRRGEAAAPAETVAPLIADDPSDYPEYRNRLRDGVAHGPALSRDWKARPPREVWRHPCGGGYAGFAVAGGRAVTVEQRRDDEVIVCYDAVSGRELWAHAYRAHFHDPRAEGPMATPTLAGGAVYSMGGTGRLVCLDLATGNLKWEVDTLADNDNLSWGMAGSPLVYDDVVVVNPGEQRGRPAGRALIAYERVRGGEAWAVGNRRAGYCSPMLATLAGVKQIVLFDGEEIAGYDIAGKGRLWGLPWTTNQGINVAQPIPLQDDRLFVSSGYGVGCGIVQVTHGDTGWDAKELRHSLALRSHFSSPVLHKQLIYGLDEGILACVDPATLQRIWKGNRYGKGQLLRCDDLLLVQCESGELALVEAAGANSRELGRFRALTGDKTWNCPCLASGKAYVRNHREMACYDLAE